MNVAILAAHSESLLKESRIKQSQLIVFDTAGSGKVLQGRLDEAEAQDSTAGALPSFFCSASIISSSHDFLLHRLTSSSCGRVQHPLGQGPVLEHLQRGFQGDRLAKQG
jgi:hypothetical protein